jgi:hypothetical protein
LPIRIPDRKRLSRELGGLRTWLELGDIEDVETLPKTRINDLLDQIDVANEHGRP